MRAYLPGVTGPPYQLQLQTCGTWSHIQATGAECSTWDTVNYTPPPPNTAPTCGTGFVAQPCPTAPAPLNYHLPANNNQTASGQSNGTQYLHPLPQQVPTGTPNGQLRAGRQDAAGACKQGFVWRGAYAGDKVCVTPQESKQAADDNRAASQRMAANGQCKQGYVWREASAQDHVCVTPQIRSQTAQDNSLATSRILAQ